MVLVVALVFQILGKQVLNKVWAYLCTLQIYLLFRSYHS